MFSLWGADVFDNYGGNECGSIAAECRFKTGMHVFEDAFVIEINDPETSKPVSTGDRGVVFLTTLFKHAARRRGINTLGSERFDFSRISRFFSRGFHGLRRSRPR